MESTFIIYMRGEKGMDTSHSLHTCCVPMQCQGQNGNNDIINVWAH